MVAFPAFAAFISLACAFVIARDAIRRPQPDKLAWTLAFAVFAVAAGAEVLGSLTEWTVTLARVYYLAGAVLIVGYLALGELYLLAGRKISQFAPGVAMLVTAIAATIVFNAPVDEARLSSDGWEAIERGAALKAIAITLNAIGTLVVVGGVVYSAWKFRRLGTHRHRMIGCLLIAIGTLTVASGGTLTRFGHREYLYIPMAIGVAVIFAGYLETRRVDAAISDSRSASLTAMDFGMQPTDENSGGQVRRPSLISLPSVRAVKNHSEYSPDPAIAFIESQFLDLDDSDLSAKCATWSVPRRETVAFTRDEARMVWALRLRLSGEGQQSFDALSVPAKLQLAEFYHEVLVDVSGTQSSVAGRSR